MKRVALLSVACLLSSSAWASRTINIALPTDAKEIKIINPSSVTVTYDLSCYNSAGTAINTYASQTLATKASTTHVAGTPDTGKCAGSVAPESSSVEASGKKLYLCSQGSPVTYANAGTKCGTGNSFCFPSTTNGCTSIPYSCSTSYWLKRDNVEVSTDGGTTYTPVANGQAPRFSNGSCSSARLSGATTSYYSVGEAADTTALPGALCCEAAVVPGFCKVTITSTDPAAHLSSPQFRGGAAF